MTGTGKCGHGAAFTQMPCPLKRKRGNGFLSFPSSTVSSTVVSNLVSEDHILVSAGIYLSEGTPVTEELAELVADGQEQIFAENCPVYPVSHARQPVCAFPDFKGIQRATGTLLCSRTGQHLSEMELGCAKRGRCRNCKQD